jgi:trehalose-phosphatase
VTFGGCDADHGGGAGRPAPSSLEEDRTRPVSRFPPAALTTALLELACRNRLLVGCDFDGTLAPFVPRPEHARIPRATREALTALARSPGVRVAVVSNRALADLTRRVAIDGVWLAGSGGHETRTPRGVVWRSRDDGPPIPLQRALRDWCARHPGTWLEVKPRGLAVHHHALPSRRRASFVAGVRRRAARFAPTLRIIATARACELLPASGHDKATVLAKWSRGLSRGAVLWLGDDASDEPAHVWVRSHGGVAVVVGRRRSVARHRLRSPRDVTRLLVWLARVRDPDRRLSGRGSAPAPRRDRATPRRRSNRPG